MNFSKQYLTDLANKSNFLRDNLEKVLRLAEILKFLNNDEIFAGNLALKGGTAINLVSVELPRLSVDINLYFVENLPKKEIEIERARLAKRLSDYMWQEGYSPMQEPREHYALLSYVFSYINNAGNRGNIKMEINFMDRCHILSLENKLLPTNNLFEPFSILTLNTTELYTSKINALLERGAPRDLYDVFAMIESGAVTDLEMLKKCLIFYNLIGGEQDIAEINFKNIEKIDNQKVKRQLKLVIAKDDKFNLETAKKTVTEFLQKLINLTNN
jgi:predicted nucleotidyltransferase component of viral defense system